jgi:lipopolysaccharide transport system permease protein
MKDYPISPLSMIRSIWIHRYLIWNLTCREVLGRYKGSLLGVLWSFVTPVLMLVIYTFVFRTAFNAKWNDQYTNSAGIFSLILFIGLIIFFLFSESVTKAPTLITGNTNFVKKIVFPLEVLPVVTIGASIFHAFISVLVWFFGYSLIDGAPPLTTLFLPLIIAPLVFFTLGLSWLLASLGVYLRDISQFIGVACQALMFMAPIFYPVSALPEKYQWIIKLNPLTEIIEQARDCLLLGLYPNWHSLLSSYLFALLVAWCGYVLFQKTRKGFADVL